MRVLLVCLLAAISYAQTGTAETLRRKLRRTLSTDCVLPAEAPNGYRYSTNATEVTAITGCSTTDCANPVLHYVECEYKWVGDIAVTQCTAEDTQVSLTGCDDNRKSSSVLFATLLIVGAIMITIALYALIPFLNKNKGIN
jgi:hypothetical protein